MAGPSLEQLVGLPGLDSAVRLVDVRVDELLRGEDSPLGVAATRVAGAGGKRLRPALTFASAAIGTPNDERVLNAAVAVELVQIGSLVHDDIIEGATVRRGIPTINAVEGDDIALMAGDYILARAGQSAALSGQAIAKAIAITVEELCIGQLVETAELFDLNRTIEAQLESIRQKTGVLYACSCRVGALSGDVPPSVEEALAAFGEAFGMAFQLIDDVLDLVSDERRLGKPANIDIATGVYTMPVLLALQGLLGAELRDRLEARDAIAAREIVLRSRTIPDVIACAGKYAELASNVLAEGVPTASPLDGFPRRYIDWALDHFPVDPALVA